MGNYNVQEKVNNTNKSSNNREVGSVQLKQNNMSDIIQRAKINPNIMTQNDAMVLQRKIGNGGLMQLFKEQGKMQEDTMEENNEKLEAEDPFQMKKNDTIQRAELAENKTGMPDNLKAGVENLSGLDMSDVRVHYNSDKPAKVGALAYTQGTEIHVGPGQEKHLAHEAWHVVQQKHGRVQATNQLKGIKVNDDLGLESEANEMGKKASDMIITPQDFKLDTESNASYSDIVQCLIYYNAHVNEFEVDGKKPAFMGEVKALPVGGGENRDHIIPYDAIQGDIAMYLSGAIVSPAGVAASPEWANIVLLSEALFPNHSASKAVMIARRGALLHELIVANTAEYERRARAFLSALNSSIDNVRVGDAGLNSAIRENLDTDFIPGVQTVPAVGLHVEHNGAVVVLPAGTRYLRLNPNSEQIVFKYERSTQLQLSFVLDAITNTQVSSVDAPQQVMGGPPVANLPVIVFDPANVANPIMYS